MLSIIEHGCHGNLKETSEMSRRMGMLRLELEENYEQDRRKGHIREWTFYTERSKQPAVRSQRGQAPAGH